MTQSKDSFTPGPWVAERSVDEWGVAVIASNAPDEISNPSRGMVCHVSIVAGATGEDEQGALANARLIAAAPALLEGCRRALELLEPFDDPDLSLGLGSEALTPIRAAIQSATGEG